MAYYKILCDGSSRGQGTVDANGSAIVGQGACAVVLYKNDRLIGQYARGLGRRNNNECEYEAVLTALLVAWAADLQDVVIYSDSAVVVKQVNGLWECKQDTLRPLLLSIQEIAEEFRFRLVQVPRRVVAEADLLASLFLDKLGTRGD